MKPADMIRTGNNIETCDSRIGILRPPVLKARFRAEIAQGMPDHTRRVSVIVSGDMLIPRCRTEHDLTELIKEPADHILCSEKKQ